NASLARPCSGMPLSLARVASRLGRRLSRSRQDAGRYARPPREVLATCVAVTAYCPLPTTYCLLSHVKSRCRCLVLDESLFGAGGAGRPVAGRRFPPGVRPQRRGGWGLGTALVQPARDPANAERAAADSRATRTCGRDRALAEL